MFGMQRIFCLLCVLAAFHYQFCEYLRGKKLIDVGHIVSVPGAMNTGICITLAYNGSLVIWAS